MTERESKFKKLAEKRVNKAIKQLRLVGNLSNRSNYTYNDEQAKKIINVLTTEFSNLKSRFKINTIKKNQDFKI